MAQIKDYTEKVTLVGTEELVIQNTGGGTTQKSQVDTVKDYVATTVGDPVGTVKTWDKTFPSTPALSSSYVECDGSVISDAGSVYNTYRSRNLNGANVALTLTWAAGIATAASTDVTALAIGDDVTGSGIAANSYISNIVGTTVTITDASASGSISSTFTNRGRFLRGNSTSGTGENDAMQKITGGTDFAGGDRAFFSAPNGGVFTSLSTTTARTSGESSTGYQLDFDSSLSVSPNAAKTDDIETRPINNTVVYIMKIK